jgi:hypothetical protein
MPLEECEALWKANESVDHPNVGLPHDWHLNRARVSVPPPPEVGLKLDVEICRRNRKLPEPMRCERMYENPQFWYDFLAWEHTAHCRSTFHFEYQPWEAYPVNEFPPTRKTTTTTMMSSRRRPTRP